jgi:hypothetical protein
LQAAERAGGRNAILRNAILIEAAVSQLSQVIGPQLHVPTAL